MNIDHLNKWLTLAANIGVLSGIVFLAIEINQNTESTQSQTRSDVATNHLWMYEMLLQNDIGELYFLNSSGQLERDTVEFLRYQTFIRAMFTVWENEWYQYTKGMYDEDSYQAQQERWKSNLANQTNIDIWKDARHLHPNGFVIQMDEVVKEMESNQN